VTEQSCSATILPNAMTPVIVQVSIALGMAILLTAGLSFIGAGVRMPAPEWGLMVQFRRTADDPRHLVDALFPGLAIVFSVLSFALVSEATRVLLDPRSRSGYPTMLDARHEPLLRTNTRDEAILALENVRVGFGRRRPALDGVSCVLRANENSRRRRGDGCGPSRCSPHHRSISSGGRQRSSPGDIRYRGQSIVAMPITGKTPACVAAPSSLIGTMPRPCSIR